ncbi:MRP-L47-domain-containing protein [Daedalea quercina L-15889]|uniref:Large ribosomal subunit protein uL29m n=1 Tax=Daedalea quercina L-15889 TaxID=1314783 RepID=A0A165TPQ9_9APHY|nr:MRP-L47-domain-containing protein [Daedalea quercina L-15889]
MRSSMQAARPFVNWVNGARSTKGKSTSKPANALPTVQKEGALRPQLNVAVNPNHGLYAFFRKNEEDGVVKYDTVEASNSPQGSSGRSWLAAELRRKSFMDLHTLWYVLLRERNLLATQGEEARRLGISAAALQLQEKRSRRCRKSMARIKYVTNERRLAYERATQVYKEQKATALAVATEAERKAIAEAEAKAQAEHAAQVAAARQEAAAKQSAAALVGAGLFDSAPEGTSSQSSSEKGSS